MRLRTRWIAAGALAVALFLPRVAAAELISIGTLQWSGTIDYLPWPDPTGTGLLLTPIAGTRARATNTSPVSFLNVEMRADWGYINTHGWDTCSAGTLATGATFECSSGPVAPAPALPNGIFYAAGVSGTLGAASFLLGDGSTFVATSTAFSSQVSWMYTAGGPPPPLSVDILVEGTIVPSAPPQSVPEPSTMALFLGGALSAYGARRRLA